MIKITGDIGQLTNYAQKLERAYPTNRQKMVSKMADDSEKEITKTSGAKSDPYGASWGTDMVESGALLGSLSVGTSGNSVKVEYTAKHAVYHQSGTKKMRAHILVPNKGLPGSWESAYVKSVNEVLERYFG